MSGRPPVRVPRAGVPGRPRGRSRPGDTAAGDPIPGYVGTDALRGRRALVVGGVTHPSGVGRTAAMALAKEGAAVAVADRGGRSDLPPGAWPLTGSDDDPLVAAARLMSSFGGWTLPIHCDPAGEGDCTGAVAHTALEFGALDVLVVCAAVGERTELAVARTARMFMAEGASVVLFGAGTWGARCLADAFAERGILVGRLLSDPGASPDDLAAAYVLLAGQYRDHRPGAALPVREVLRGPLAPARGGSPGGPIGPYLER